MVCGEILHELVTWSAHLSQAVTCPWLLSTSVTARLITVFPLLWELFLSSILREQCNQRSFKSFLQGLARARGERRLKLLKFKGEKLWSSEVRVTRDEFPKIIVFALYTLLHLGKKTSPTCPLGRAQRQKFARGNIVFGRCGEYYALFITFGQLQRWDVSNGKVSPLECYHHRDLAHAFVLQKLLNTMLS